MTLSARDERMLGHIGRVDLMINGDIRFKGRTVARITRDGNYVAASRGGMAMDGFGTTRKRARRRGETAADVLARSVFAQDSEVNDELTEEEREEALRNARDAEGDSPDLDGAYKHMYRAMDHLADARDGKIEFDEDIFGGHLGKMNECLQGGAEDEEEALATTTSPTASDSALRRRSRRVRAMDEALASSFDSMFQRE